MMLCCCLGSVPHTQMTSNTIVTMTMASHSSHATAVTTSAIPVGKFDFLLENYLALHNHVKFCSMFYCALVTVVLTLCCCSQLKWSLSPSPTRHPDRLTTQEREPTSSPSQGTGRLLTQAPWKREVRTGKRSIFVNWSFKQIQIKHPHLICWRTFISLMFVSFQGLRCQYSSSISCRLTPHHTPWHTPTPQSAALYLPSASIQVSTLLFYLQSQLTASSHYISTKFIHIGPLNEGCDVMLFMWYINTDQSNSTINCTGVMQQVFFVGLCDSVTNVKIKPARIWN